MSGQSNLERAKAFFDAIGRGELSAVDQSMTPDVDYVVISEISSGAHDALPWVGRHRGREAVRGYLRRLAAAQPGTVTIERWVADADVVVAFGRVTTRSRGTGREASWELAFRLEFVGGLIGRYHLYEDSYSAVLLHRAEGEWTLAREGERIRAPDPAKSYARPLEEETRNV